MDLAKVGEIHSIQVVGHGEDAKKYYAAVNKLLDADWALLSVKVVDHDRVVYVLGRPRQKAKQEQAGAHLCEGRNEPPGE